MSLRSGLIPVTWVRTSPQLCGQSVPLAATWLDLAPPGPESHFWFVEEEGLIPRHLGICHPPVWWSPEKALDSVGGGQDEILTQSQFACILDQEGRVSNYAEARGDPSHYWIEFLAKIGYWPLPRPQSLSQTSLSQFVERSHHLREPRYPQPAVVLKDPSPQLLTN